MRDMYDEDNVGEEEIGFPAGDDNRNPLAQGSTGDDIQEIEMYLDGIEQRPKSSPTQSKSPAGSLAGTTPKAPAANLRFQIANSYFQKAHLNFRFLIANSYVQNANLNARFQISDFGLQI